MTDRQVSAGEVMEYIFYFKLWDTCNISPKEISILLL
jgi:hypothetical protein